VPHRSRLSPDTSPATGFDHKVLPQEKHWLDHAIAVVVSVDRACHAIADSMIGRYALDLLRARRARKSRR
jgi:predicted subunit of tRNA(5-methylaminomethyl-2-thiouridylate) methyltransferase